MPVYIGVGKWVNKLQQVVPNTNCKKCRLATKQKATNVIMCKVSNVCLRVKVHGIAEKLNKVNLRLSP